jgi:hypothetical protein
MIRLTIYSAYVSNVEKPNSLLLIARPECGKSELLKRFMGNRNLAFLSDATFFGIERDYLHLIEAKEVRFLVFLDLLMPFAHKPTTVRTFISNMNGLIEEGRASSSSYVTHRVGIDKPVKCGLIAAITGDALGDQRHQWGRVGFLSRVIPFSYSYGAKTVKNVFDSIIGLDYMHDQNVTLNLPRSDTAIHLPMKHAKELLVSTTTIAKAQHTYGFRMQKQFQNLLMASALEQGRARVNSYDVRRIRYLMNWVNFDESPLDFGEKTRRCCKLTI